MGPRQMGPHFCTSPKGSLIERGRRIVDQLWRRARAIHSAWARRQPPSRITKHLRQVMRQHLRQKISAAATSASTNASGSPVMGPDFCGRMHRVSW